MGYCGGTTPDPTYTTIGDHSETIQIDYDPLVITYAELVDVFWIAHNPASPSTCTQYMSAIFYHDEDQRQLAEQTKQALEAIHGTIHTEISAVRTFYRAEDYHQKYYLRNVTPVITDFNVIYPDPLAFTDSTAAARVNGVIARHYTADRLAEDIADFGLSAAANERLWSYVQ